jgi:uncharacterized protein YeaO (DUF488 family)
MASSQFTGKDRQTIQLRRAYDPPAPLDGKRFLVDRLWPRGKTKASLQLDAWIKDVAPSTELRKWFAHDPVKWPEFKKRYRKELATRPDSLDPLLEAARKGPITLVYGAKDEIHNEAVVLKEILTECLEPNGQSNQEALAGKDTPRK